MSLSIIHLSDIHIDRLTDLIVSRVDSLKRACAGTIQNDSDVVIVITGDIAYSGKEEQYKLADAILQEISNYLIKEKNARVSFAIVPGNHDCDFNQCNSVRSTLIDSIKQSVDNDVYTQVVSVQNNYFNFAKIYGVEANDIISTQEVNVSSDKILFIKINTAWMSILQEKPGRIIIPEKVYPKIELKDYKLVVAIYHHPDSWLNPDYKKDFINFIRYNSDIVLIGHEHIKDTYQQKGYSFSLLYNYGKELQDNTSGESAFSIISFDDQYQNNIIYNYNWQDNCYKRQDSPWQPFRRNDAVYNSVFYPNSSAIGKANDIGITVNHFAKDNVILPDLYIWPDLYKTTYAIKESFKRVKDNVFEELTQNNLNIIWGPSFSGKTALAKFLYLKYIDEDVCCILLDGGKINTTKRNNLGKIIDNAFVEQYLDAKLDEFRYLNKEKRIIIIDDFDKSCIHGEKLNDVMDYFCNGFEHVYLLLSSDIEIPALLSLKAFRDLPEVVIYQIMPFGNLKRRELISKWYYLNEESRDEDDTEKRIDESVELVDNFIGKGSQYLPAYPMYIIYVLQIGDSIKPSYKGSQYGFLYETMIQKSLLANSLEYKPQGAYNTDISIVSYLAFYMLTKKRKTFSEDDLNEVVNQFNKVMKMEISKNDLLRRMLVAKIFFKDTSEGELYRFKYPYIFYFFAGHYIAYHIDDNNIKDIIDEMSSKLYIEEYGNIMIFVCHFANNQDIIDAVLKQAYETLKAYELFDFSRADSIITDLSAVIEAMIPKYIGGNSEVEANKKNQLMKLDDIGINDGRVCDDDDFIEDKIEDTDGDLASILAAFKILDVLGQILQNFPGSIKGDIKIGIIDEIYKLGMRAVQAIYSTVINYQSNLAEFILDRMANESKQYKRIDVETTVKRFISVIIAQMIRAMINKVAISLNSPLLLPVAKEVFMSNNSMATRLIMMELKVNCFKKVDFQEISNLQNELDNEKGTKVALCILRSIIAHYLMYNKCDYKLRSKLCSKFDLSEKKALISGQKNN